MAHELFQLRGRLQVVCGFSHLVCQAAGVLCVEETESLARRLARRIGGNGLFQSFHIGRRLAAWLLLMLAYALVVEFLVNFLRLPKWPAGDEVTAILGIALGTLVVFHNNAAYDRWWEARKHWGQLINDLRNLALKTRAHAAVDASERRAFAQLLVAFANALRRHLRGEDALAALPGLDCAAAFPHAPGHVAGLIHQTLDRWNRGGQLAGTVWILDHHARALMDACGACERIQNTPLAASYRAMTRYGIALYLATAPWAIALDMGWSGLPAIVLASAFLLGMELTADTVEEPFGREGDDLPLDIYCTKLEAFLLGVLDDPAGGLGSEAART